MNRHEARNLLDAVRAGKDVPSATITHALRVTGDLRWPGEPAWPSIGAQLTPSAPETAYLARDHLQRLPSSYRPEWVS